MSLGSLYRSKIWERCFRRPLPRFFIAFIDWFRLKITTVRISVWYPFPSIMTERRCKYTNFLNNFQIFIYKDDYFSDNLYNGIILNKSMLIVIDIFLKYKYIYKSLRYKILYIFEKSNKIFRKLIGDNLIWYLLTSKKLLRKCLVKICKYKMVLSM